MFEDFPQSELKIVAADGTVRGVVKGIVDSKQATIPNKNAVIHVGDEIRRKLPNGTEETFEVVDPVYFDNFHGIPAHYQVKIRRKGTFPAGKGGNFTLNVSGQNSRVNISSQDYSTNLAIEGSVFDTLKAKLEGSVSDREKLSELLAAIETMKRQQQTPGFAAAYQKFVSLTADHLSLVAPFLPALTKFFG